MQVFDDVVMWAKYVLFIDEGAALPSDRSSTADGDGEYSRTAASLLTRIVDIRSEGVLLVAASSYINRLDAAAIRESRFDTKIEITAPDDVARQALIRRCVLEAADHLVWRVGETVASLSRHWAGFSVSRIRAVARLTGRRASERGVDDVPIAMFQSALREVQGSFGDCKLAEVRDLQTLHCYGEVCQRLTDLGQAMRETFAFEQRGGRMAGGVLFYGPPGTGKTIAARALAKSAG
jgi:transitional endoplasmic reticulum ATPase